TVIEFSGEIQMVLSRFLEPTRVAALLLIVCVLAAAVPSVHAYYVNGRWSNTASGSTGSLGSPATLTWSIVPDGTSISGGKSSLISFLDTTFGAGSGGSDLTSRPWYTLFTDSFNRWSQLSGVTFNYESHDDGTTHNAGSGVLGVRGDIRIAGGSVDGPSGAF